MKELTIAIITYNRKDSLLKQLLSIEKQGHYDLFDVLICDNASCYDLQREVISNLNVDFRKIITIHKNSVNIGGAANIAQSFQFVHTPWMWMLSDDDYTKPGSVKRVLEDIKKCKDACWLKYSIWDNKLYENKKISGLANVFSEFANNFGQFVFMSTNVFSMEKIRPYIGLAPCYIHTCFCQQIPALHSIKCDSSYMCTIGATVVDYSPDAATYKLHYAFTNYCNLPSSQFELTDEEFDAYKKLFAISYKYLYISLLELKYKKQRREYYKKYKFFISNKWHRLGLTILYHFPFIYKIWLTRHQTHL